ncbi:telomere-protecting terminal protein Tpg [Streptomyces sp. NPDC056528]|uniref:telomere-protecting terminal protein Tpg n=1 Tax=Streptomyces sp. NPDC056528 TaxID=3345854 RepID=UPI0036B531FA
MPPLSLSANTVQEALDRADARHWTRNPPRSPRARVAFLLSKNGHDHTALAARLRTTPQTLESFGGPPNSQGGEHEHSALQQAVEREVIRLWQPRIRRRAHATILHNNGQMMISFRAWLGFTAAAGSSDDPRLRTLALSLHAPHVEALFSARHRDAPEPELVTLLSGALSACYFHRNRLQGTTETVRIERIDYLEFYY